MKKLSFESSAVAFILVWQLLNIGIKLTTVFYTNWWVVFMPFIIFFGIIGLCQAIKTLITQNPEQ